MSSATMDESTSTVSATGPHIADGLNAATATVQLKDANGNYLTADGERVTVSATGSAVVSAVSDNGDGTYTAKVTNTVVDTVAVRAAINGRAITSGDRGVKFFRCEGWRRSAGQC